jgi:hypothetical protein
MAIHSIMYSASKLAGGRDSESVCGGSNPSPPAFAKVVLSQDMEMGDRPIHILIIVS